MFLRSDIVEDETFHEFLQSRYRKPTTQKEYINRILNYCNYTQLNPTELIEEAEKEQDEGIRRRKRRIKKYIFNFIEELKKTNKSITTIRHTVETVKLFYSTFDIDPPSTRGAFPTNIDNPVYEKLPVREQIQKALNTCKTRDKAILLTQFSSGMGASELISLNYSNFIEAIQDYTDLEGSEQFDIFKIIQQTRREKELIGTWNIRRIKTGMYYTTFTSTEATRAIIDYLSDRIRMNKPVESMDDALFVNQFNDRISIHVILKVYGKMNNRAGLGKRNEKRNTLTSHVLRKLFATTCYAAGVDQMKVDWMLGHKINPTTSAYFKAKPERLKSDYRDIEAKLTLSEVEVRDVSPRQVKDIVRELDAQKEENKKQQVNIDFLMNVITENPYLLALEKDPAARELLDQYLEKKKTGK